jgi:predicted phosphoadenosine phosphosulfate sulfurtransferase|uniref:Phosphoadenosine-phosphosulfate reductase n=1 Tax=Podoviridae sp. ctrTt13 TaxID=2825279 RepID=A0A8S5NTR8_9CAUD|nr:MAG TPA: phosphoadenosine-phosphosulfate reductase [Podoviridae sp. ctrTt13]
MNQKNVYDLAQERLEVIFREFDNIYVSFSGGKDSGVLLNMCIDHIRKNGLKRRIGVFHMDYEIQYSMTVDYVERTLHSNLDVIDVYHVCVPFRVTTCTSMYQNYWRPWDDAEKEVWVRKMPDDALTVGDFPFYDRKMWDYDFQVGFSRWLHGKKRAGKTCCLVGIRTQESYNRWRAIYKNAKERYNDYEWSTRIDEGIYNLYPLYDWKTEDVWVANGKFGWDYNHLYDLYYQAGVSLDRQRVASPFISEAIESLALYKVIDPDTWGRMIGRVNGVNFSGIYGNTHAAGRKSVKLPEGYTWKGFMEFLLSTLPEATRNRYLKKLDTSIRFWRERGGCLSDEVIQKLRDRNIPIEVGEGTNYKTDKKPVRMEYQDDIDIEDFREIPTYKRMCICILRNDHVCKYMGFSLNKEENEMRRNAMRKYDNIVNDSQ